MGSVGGWVLALDIIRPLEAYEFSLVRHVAIPIFLKFGHLATLVSLRFKYNVEFKISFASFCLRLFVPLIIPNVSLG